MRILHVLGGDLSGGAARGAYALHRGLRAGGVESRVLMSTDSGPGSTDPSVRALRPGKWGRLQAAVHRQLDQLPLRPYGPTRHHMDTALFGFSLHRAADYRWADLIHLHYVNDGMLSLRSLGQIDKPVVWTLRDMWPLTGGCHYALDCVRYQGRCGACPLLGSAFEWDATRWLLAAKGRALPRDLQLVGLSRWLAECARRSTLFRGRTVAVIPNGIDVDRFSPVDRASARSLLSLPPDGPVIAVGAIDHGPAYKGYDLLSAALPNLRIARGTVLTFGRTPHPPPLPEGLRLVELGQLRDDTSLRLAYAAADVFVAPSRQEAFGKTLVEAMACGTPSVCFDATGPRDIVDHRETGYLARAFSPGDLARGIEWVLAEPGRAARLGQAARAVAVERFAVARVAAQYTALYGQVLARRGARAAAQ